MFDMNLILLYLTNYN
jgi:hypothetical protein